MILPANWFGSTRGNENQDPTGEGQKGGAEQDTGIKGWLPLIIGGVCLLILIIVALGVGYYFTYVYEQPKGINIVPEGTLKSSPHPNPGSLPKYTLPKFDRQPKPMISDRAMRYAQRGTWY